MDIFMAGMPYLSCFIFYIIASHALNSMCGSAINSSPNRWLRYGTLGFLRIFAEYRRPNDPVGTKALRLENRLGLHTGQQISQMVTLPCGFCGH